MSSPIGGNILQAAYEVFKSFKTGRKPVERAQLSNIVGVYEQYRSIEMVKLYLVRQAGRGRISLEAARTLIEKLEQNYSDRIVELIGLVRWFYDAVENREREIDLEGIDRYEEFISRVAGVS